jgi:hypothetical protein
MSKVTGIIVVVIASMNSVSVSAHTSSHADVGIFSRIIHEFKEVGQFTYFEFIIVGLLIVIATIWAQYRKYKAEK